MRILVTGAAGLVGASAVRESLGRGHEVIALVRDLQGARLPRDHALEVRRWDLLRARDYGLPGGPFDGLLHFAAHVPSNMADPGLAEQCFRHNAFAVEELIDVAASVGVPHFVLASAGTLYVNRGKPAAEEDAMYPPRHAPYYLSSKLAGEIFAREAADRHGMRLTTLRIGSVYGGAMRAGAVVARFLDQAAAGQPHQIHNGHHTSDFVYADDVAAAAVASVERRAAGVFNVGSGAATSIYDLSLAANAAVGRPVPGNAITVEPDGSRSGFPALDIRRAAAELSYSPTSLQEGLRLTAAARGLRTDSNTTPP